MTIVDRILERKLIGIIRLEHYDRAVEVARALGVGGNLVPRAAVAAGAFDQITAAARACAAAVE